MESLTLASSGLWTLLLAIVLLGSLLLIPLGLPGLWLMLGAALLHSIVVPGSAIGMFTLVGCTVLVLIAEFLEFTLSASYARKYGGSKRASWGAILGGFLGAFLGIPVPIIGPMIGAFVGAFAGAFLGELTVSQAERGSPGRVAWGAIVGRAVATAMKTFIGIVVATWIFTRALA